jgi:UDP-3-O-[3-hydroxymyristoyl] glucosamine N-acyltransferase
MSRAYTAAELAESEGLELRGDGDTPIRRVAPLDRAEADAIAFLALASHRRHLATTRAGAVILTAEMAEACPTTALVSPNPHASYARIAQLLHPRAHPPAGIHPSAVVGEGCRLGAGVSIGANAVLGDDCVLGADVVIGAGSVLGNRVTVRGNRWRRFRFRQRRRSLAPDPADRSRGARRRRRGRRQHHHRPRCHR